MPSQSVDNPNMIYLVVGGLSYKRTSEVTHFVLNTLTLKKS